MTPTRPISAQFPRQSGFTLLEVLLALGIVSIALLALSHSHAVATRGLSDVQQHLYAMWVADNAITSIRLNERAVEQTRHSGQQQMGQHNWYWQIVLEASPDPAILRAETSVFLDLDQPAAVFTTTGFLANDR